MIMPRTYIIAADGTRYIPEGTARRSAKRTALAIFAIITALFLAAAIIGLTKGAQGDYNAAPTASATPVIKLSDAQRACKGAPKKIGSSCLELYLRNAWRTPSTFTPAGPALVKECFDQYRGIELADCLTQEV